MELNRKGQQLGKMKEIVKEADNRLSELKENRQNQDFLEKKQRVLSVENNKLKHSVKRAEMQLNEKENLVESQNRQLKEISNNYRRLEEVKTIEIELLKNEIRQKDGLVEELREDLNVVEAARDRLGEDNAFLREENEQLKRMCQDNLKTIKEITSQNLQNYVKRRNSETSNGLSVLERICKYQVTDTREISKISAADKGKNESFSTLCLDTAHNEEAGDPLRASLDSLKHLAVQSRNRSHQENFESTRLNNNMEVIIEAFETSLAENRVLGQKLEDADRALQELEFD